MADVTVAAAQEEIADSLVAEPQQEATEQTSVTEQEQPEAQEPQVEVQQQETAEDWFPSDQDKVFPDDVYARYATERYGLTPEQAADPQIRQMLHDKINSDIWIRNQQQTFEQQQQEPHPEPEPVQEQPRLTPEQHFAQLERYAQERTDPQAAKWFHSNFLRAFGVPEAEIAKIPEQQAIQFGRVATAGISNVVNTTLDDILQTRIVPLLSQAFPGFDEMYERSSHAMAWDRVRNSDPKFSSLPSYGTKEFSSTLRRAAAGIPGFDEMQFTDGSGRPLPLMDNSMRKYEMLARVASGGNVDPQMLQRAAAAGAQQARRADVRRAAGNLGSGQSQSSGGPRVQGRFKTNSDLFDEDTMDAYQREHGKL